MPTLADLGWDASWAAAFAPFAADGLTPARLSLEHNHVYRVLDEQGEQLVELAGRIKHEAAGRNELPAVGDWVALRPDVSGGRALIQGILPRRSVFSRKQAGRETEEQVVATNIDTVFLVSGLDHDFNLRRIERYLVMARQSGAQPVIVLNKSDLREDLEAVVAEVTALAPGVPVHTVRAKGQEPDVDALRQYLGGGRTVALLGSSGGGKSTIINALAGHEMLKTAEVRESDSRGRHTSVSRHLVVLEAGGLVIDTPGMRELQLWETGESVDVSFPEIDELAGNCRFRDCSHDREPGCAVKQAVLDAAIPQERYDSFLKLQAERAAFARKHEERALIDQKRQSKAGSKALKALYKDRGRR
jgi:ribosome biogenesis GTPase